MASLFVATGNLHKVAEIRDVLGPNHVCLTGRDLGRNLEIAETGRTFSENATIKAVAWAECLSSQPPASKIDWVLADDSGLELDVLGGAPGVHSARFAALDEGRHGNSTDADNNAKLLRLLEKVPEVRRTARFRCVLALTPISGKFSAPEFNAATQHFTAECEGRIQPQAAGSGGFGYDPLFVPEGYSLSFAELGEEIKNNISHRARALAKLAVFLNNRSRGTC